MSSRENSANFVTAVLSSGTAVTGFVVGRRDGAAESVRGGDHGCRKCYGFGGLVERQMVNTYANSVARRMSWMSARMKKYFDEVCQQETGVFQRHQ